MGATGWKDKKLMEARCSDILQLVGIEHKINVMPHVLSGGEQQRVSIARALINQIKIFWDEENLQHQIQINYKFDKHSEILLTKNLTLTYKKMGYSIRAKNYLENIRVELRSPSPRSLDVPDSKYLHIHHQSIK